MKFNIINKDSNDTLIYLNLNSIPSEESLYLDDILNNELSYDSNTIKTISNTILFNLGKYNVRDFKIYIINSKIKDHLHDLVSFTYIPTFTNNIKLGFSLVQKESSNDINYIKFIILI